MEQTGNALTFLAIFVDRSTLAGATGLTVTATLRRDATILSSGAACAEIGDGLYSVTLAAEDVDSEGLYTATFSCADPSVSQHQYWSGWAVGKGGVEHLDAAISSRLAASAAQGAAQAALTAQGYTTTRAGYMDALNGLVASVWAYGSRTLTGFGTLVADIWAYGSRTLTSVDAFLDGIAASIWAENLPGSYLAGSAGYKVGKIGTADAIVIAPAVAADELRIVAGDDYKIADGRQISWTLAGVPDLTSATVTFTGAGLTKGTTTTSDTVTMELASADTESTVPDVYEFELAAELVGGALITLVRGTMVVS